MLEKHGNIHLFRGLVNDALRTSRITHLLTVCNMTVFFLLALQPIVGLYFTALYRALASSLTRFLDHTQRRATVGRTPLYE